MTNLETVVEQARIFLVQNVPADFQNRSVLLAIGVLIAGIGISSLGAKLARPGFTALVGALGATIGVWFSRQLGHQDVVGGLVGAAMAGTVAFLTYRMWVGILVGAVMASVALGSLGYQKVVPHAGEFQRTTMISPASLTLPTIEQQDAYIQQSPQEWMSKFWAFCRDRDASLEQNSRLIGVGAAMFGLFLGVIAVRWTMILATSVLGAVFVTSSLMTLSSEIAPNAYRSFLTHPGLVGTGIGAFMVTSWIVQTLVTRRAPDAGSDSSSKRA